MDNFGMSQSKITNVRQALDAAIRLKYPRGFSSFIRALNEAKGNVVSQQNLDKFLKQGKRIPGWLPVVTDFLGIDMDRILAGDVKFDEGGTRTSGGLADSSRRAKREKILDLLDEFCKLSPLEQEKLMIMQEIEKKEPPTTGGLHDGKRTNKGHK